MQKLTKRHIDEVCTCHLGACAFLHVGAKKASCALMADEGEKGGWCDGCTGTIAKDNLPK